MTIVELSHLSKRFGAIQALRDVDATITGNIIGLLGPNGAGKSTLLKCLLGLIPFEGRATVLGLSAATDGSTIRDRVGYMPEQEALLGEMSAVELCTYAGELSGLPRTEAMQRAHAALYYAGLEDKRYQPIEGYSTGMKQRVKLAQALVHDPELLFLDEPTNGLDPRSRDEMLDLIVNLPQRRGCTIILSTHLLPDVERVCDHAVIMHQATVKFVGTIDELRGARGDDTALTVEVKADAHKLAAALSESGATCTVTSPVELAVDLPLRATTELVFRRARDAGIQVRGIEVRRESVEAAFLRVVGDDKDVAALSESTIHDLGYKRYVGTRRPPSTRWRVIARHQMAAGWQTFWRYKAWLSSAVIATVIAAVFIFIATDSRWHLGHGLQLTFANMALPFALDWYARLSFIITLRLGSTVIASDLQSGAFTFYFARSTRPIDYLFGKVAGLGTLLGVILIGGPLAVALMRIGLAGAGSTDALVPQLWLVPKVLVIGGLATLAYTTVPLAFSALVDNRRYALGVWAAWYLIAGPIAYGIGRLTHLPLAALDIASSVKSITLHLLDAPVTPWGQSVNDLPSLTASVVSLGIQIALAIAIVLWRLDAAQRSGVGGAT